MTAYELADELNGRLDHKAANMLIKQADRIAELEKEVKRLIGAEPITYGMFTFCKNCGQKDPYSPQTSAEPVAWIDPKELDMDVSTSVTKHKQFDADIPLYTTPQTYCPSENNEAYEKGFIDGMSKQRQSNVDRFINSSNGIIGEIDGNPIHDLVHRKVEK